MSESKFSRAVVARLLHTTRKAWLQPPSPAAAVLPAAPRPISSHRLVRQHRAPQRHPVWGLPAPSTAATPLKAGVG